MFHELYHISPRFDGDIRRMGAFKKAHGHSRKAFEERYINFAEDFWAYVKNTPYHAFLNMKSDDFHRSFQKVHYRRMKTIKPVEVRTGQKI